MSITKILSRMNGLCFFFDDSIGFSWWLNEIQWDKWEKHSSTSIITMKFGNFRALSMGHLMGCYWPTIKSIWHMGGDLNMVDLTIRNRDFMGVIGVFIPSISWWFHGTMASNMMIGFVGKQFFSNKNGCDIQQGFSIFETNPHVWDDSMNVIEHD